MIARGCRAGIPGLLALLALAGCAGLGPSPPPAPQAAAIRSAEYHYLVGRELEMDGDLAAASEAFAAALRLDPDSTHLLRKLAELAARQNRVEEALGYAERAHALEPDDLGLRLFLGTLYRFTKNLEGAQRVLLDEAGDPVSGDAALLVYGLLSESNRLEEADRVARWLMEREPEGLRGFFAVADARERQGDHAGAEQALRQGLEKHPGDLSLYGQLARGRRDRGDREGEIEIYREILAEHPDHHASVLAMADALLELERLDEAVEALRRVESRNPDDLRTVLRLGFIEFERRNFDEAAERFRRALSTNPEQHEVRYFLGIVQRRQRQNDEALESFGRIPASHERYSEARTQIAAIYEGRGDYVRAIQEVETARLQQPSRPLDLYLASLRSKSGDLSGALGFLEALLAENPDDPELLYNLGVIHGEAQQVDQALGYMSQVLESDPDHAGALNYVGYTWAERGQNLDEAEAYITRALSIRPDDGYITDSLGWIYYMRARPLIESGDRAGGMRLLDRAVTELERANELTGGDPVVSEHLGDAYLLRGMREDALERYLEAVELGPRPGEQPELLEKLERLKQELGAP